MKLADLEFVEGAPLAPPLPNPPPRGGRGPFVPGAEGAVRPEAPE